jgi:hypothetical protein
MDVVDLSLLGNGCEIVIAFARDNAWLFRADLHTFASSMNVMYQCISAPPTLPAYCSFMQPMECVVALHIVRGGAETKRLAIRALEPGT